MFLRTLGDLRLEDGALHQAKPLLLLAYLSLEGAKPRRFLAELFWPEAANPRNSLRVALGKLQREAPGAVTAGAVQVEPHIDSDAAQLLRTFEMGECSRVVDLYSGPFLEGVNVAWGAELEEWVYETRERVAARVREAALYLGEEAASHGEFLMGAEWAETALGRAGTSALDPEETERLYTLLRAGGSVQAAALRKEAAEFGPSFSLTVAQARARLSQRPGRAVSLRLPLRNTPFVGRVSERAELAELLADAACRLLTLVGLGGVGKTRLAVQVALEQHGAGGFRDGVHFVSLEAAPSPDTVPTMLASILQVNLQSAADPLTLVARAIGNKRVLLVLDNFEHLVDGAVLLGNLLSDCPNLKLLITSRERLNLEEEVPYVLKGLPFAEDPGAAAATPGSDALTLFLDRAKRAKRTFELTHANRPHVLAIVRGTQGLPLALELAATWVRVLSCEEMVRAFDLSDAPTRLRNLPERHRGLRTVFEQSWRLLTAQEKEVLRRLAVFRGNFPQEAATAVAGATLPLLARLVDKSWLEPTATGSYAQHPLLHQYAREKLTAHPAELLQSRERQAQYALALVEAAEPHLTGAQQGPWLDRLEDEYADLRAVLAWSAENDVDTGLRMGAALWRFWVVRGYMREGRAQLEGLLAHPRAQGKSRARAAALTGLGTLIFELGDSVGSKPVLAEALKMLRDLGDERGLATNLNHLGWITAQLGEIRASKALNKEALTLNTRLGQTRGVAVSLNNLGWLALYQGDFVKARELLSDSLALRLELGDRRGAAYAQVNLAWAERYLGHLTEANGRLETALGTLRQLGDHQLVAWALYQKGCLALARGEVEDARQQARASERLWREVGNHDGIALTLTTLADLTRICGELEEAAALLGEAQRLWQRLGGYQWAVAGTLLSQAELSFENGDGRQARSLVQKSLAIRHAIHDRHGLVEGWEALARFLGSQSPEQAVWLLAAAQRLRERSKAPLPPGMRESHEHSLETLRATLGEPLFATAWSKGRGLKRTDLIRLEGDLDLGMFHA